MLTIYDITNDYLHWYATDLLTARQILTKIQRETELDPDTEWVTCHADSFECYSTTWGEVFVYRIQEVEVLNDAPENIFDYAK